MTLYALRWSISGAFVTYKDVPLLFAREDEALDYKRRHYDYLATGRYESPGGIPEPVKVEVRAV